MPFEVDEPQGERPISEEYADQPGKVAGRNDQDIARDIESSLFYDDLVRSYLVRISVIHGVVTLAGTVHDEFEKRRAVEDTRKIFGVKQVVDDLEIIREAGL